MSDAEEGSSSESLCSARKLPHRNASAVARKKLLHGADDQSLKSDTEDLKEQNPALSVSSPHTAQGSVSDSESEGDLRVARKGWHANGCTPHAAATCRAKLLPTESSEEDSGGHQSGNGPSSAAAPSASGQKLGPECISEEADSEPGSSALCKNAHFFKKAKILSDSEDCEEQGRETRTGHQGEGSPISETLKPEAVLSPRCLSGGGSETDMDSDVSTVKEKSHSNMNGNSRHSPAH